MENINFDNTPDNSVPFDLSKFSDSLTQDLRRVSDELNKSLSPVLKNFANHIINMNLKQSFEKSLLELSNAVKKNMTVSYEQLLSSFNKSIEDCFKDIEEPTRNEEVVIDFSVEQLNVFENCNININDYANKDKSTENTKFLTFDRIIMLIGLLLSLISVLKQDNVQIECCCQNNQQVIVEQQKQIDNLNDIVENLTKQLSATYDCHEEATTEQNPLK